MPRVIQGAIAALTVVCLLLASPALAEDGDGSGSYDSGPIADPYIPEMPDPPAIETPDYGSIPEPPQIVEPDYGSIPDPPAIETPDYSATSTETNSDSGGTAEYDAGTGSGAGSYDGVDGSSETGGNEVPLYQPDSVAPPAEATVIDPAPYNPDVGSTYDPSGSSSEGETGESNDTCWTVDGIGVCQ